MDVHIFFPTLVFSPEFVFSIRKGFAFAKGINLAPDSRRPQRQTRAAVIFNHTTYTSLSFRETSVL